MKKVGILLNEMMIHQAPFLFEYVRQFNCSPCIVMPWEFRKDIDMLVIPPGIYSNMKSVMEISSTLIDKSYMNLRDFTLANYIEDHIPVLGLGEGAMLIWQDILGQKLIKAPGHINTSHGIITTKHYFDKYLYFKVKSDHVLSLQKTEVTNYDVVAHSTSISRNGFAATSVNDLKDIQSLPEIFISKGSLVGGTLTSPHLIEHLHGSQIHKHYHMYYGDPPSNKLFKSLLAPPELSRVLAPVL